MKFFGKNSKWLQFINYFFIIVLFSIGISAKEPGVDGLQVGEEISYFDIEDKDGKSFNLSLLGKSKKSIVFIMSQPCRICQKNKAIWQRIFALTKKRIRTYCILLEDYPKLVEFSETNLFKFPLYCPKHIDKFKENFLIYSRKARTILLKDKKVIYSKSGILDIEDYKQIINLTKGE